MRNDKKNSMATLATLIALGAPVLSAQAAEDRWTFELTPYLWIVGMDGEVTVNGQSVDFDVSASDMMDVANSMFGFLGAAQYGRIVFWVQADYLSQDTDEQDDPPPGKRLELDTRLTMLAAGYQFDGWAKGQTIDVLIGARMADFDRTLTVDGVGTFKKDSDVTDTVLVVRPSFPLSGRWRFNPTLSYGSGDSETVYELQPQFQYQISKTWATRIGFRTLTYDLESNGGNELDVTFSGFFIGFGGPL